jgi:hypothetical protein
MVLVHHVPMPVSASAPPRSGASSSRPLNRHIANVAPHFSAPGSPDRKVPISIHARSIKSIPSTNIHLEPNAQVLVITEASFGDPPT